MKKTILTKLVSAVLCASMAVSFASCTAKAPKETDEEEETTLISKPENGGAAEISEETSETTAETSESTTETTEATTAATTEATTEATTATTAPKVNPYDRFIVDYANAMKDPSDTWYYGPDYEGDTVFPPEGTVGLYIFQNREAFGYALVDLDKDGTDELIIGGKRIYGDGTSSVDVTGVVVLTGEDEYKIVAAGWDRSTLTYTGGLMFVNSGSGGASLHIDTIYQYNNVTKQMDTVCELITEYEGRDADGNMIVHYSLFEGDNYHYNASSAYESEDASCHDDEAMNKYNQMLEAANKDLADTSAIEWTRVPLN